VNRDDNSVMGTVTSVVVVFGALLGFCAFFTVFLIVPFVIFLIGLFALVYYEQKQKAAKRKKASALPPGATS
jgi:5-bromo-4-chloroindolyl phosphate hydrolysis protein